MAGCSVNIFRETYNKKKHFPRKHTLHGFTARRGSELCSFSNLGWELVSPRVGRSRSIPRCTSSTTPHRTISRSLVPPRETNKRQRSLKVLPAPRFSPSSAARACNPSGGFKGEVDVAVWLWAWVECALAGPPVPSW